MNPEFTSFFFVLAFLWFIIYWVLGGVFFALVAVIRLGRLRKVRFSCLYSILALVVGIVAAYGGINGSQTSVSNCLEHVENNVEKMMAIFGCGATSIFGTFLFGGFVLTIGGFFIMAVSKSKSQPWIVLDHDEIQEQQLQDESTPRSRFFEG